MVIKSPSTNMSISTSLASTRGGGPRKPHFGMSNPKPQGGSRKQQSSNSEEEIAQR